MIRKKALMCFLRFHQVLPSAVAPHREELKKTLYDTDASVMGASLVLHQEMTRVRRHAFLSLLHSVLLLTTLSIPLLSSLLIFSHGIILGCTGFPRRVPLSWTHFCDHFEDHY